MSWWRRKPLDPVVAAYIDATSRRVPDKTPLSELRFVSLDAETTGFDATKDRMLSLALVEVQGGRIQIAKSAAWVIFQAAAPMTQAVSVHGILPAETKAGLPEAEVLRELLPRLSGAILLGHHVHFDAAMLTSALQRHYRTSLRNPMLDTAKLAMETLDAFAKTGYLGQRAPSLDEVCAQSGVPTVERHTAEGDAFTTAMIFISLCARLQRRLERPLRAEDLPLAGR